MTDKRVEITGRIWVSVPTVPSFIKCGSESVAVGTLEDEALRQIAAAWTEGLRERLSSGKARNVADEQKALERLSMRVSHTRRIARMKLHNVRIEESIYALLRALLEERETLRRADLEASPKCASKAIRAFVEGR